MGAFYGSILVRTEDAEAVRHALGQVAKDSDNRFLVGPALNGWVSIFPNNSGQSDKVSAEIAKRISDDVFHLIVHDDDIFSYYFYRKGTLVDHYNSCPNYFHEVSDEEKRQCEGQPELFQDLLLDRESLNEVKNLLRANKEEYVFEQERMAKFAKLLGFANATSSYEYLQSGERHGIDAWKKFVHIPDLTSEKNAKRAEQSKIRAEKKELQKAGILLAEIEPSIKSKNILASSIAWATDSSSNGILLTRQTNQFANSGDGRQNSAEFCCLVPSWNQPLRPVELNITPTAYVFAMSPSGDWLGGGFAYGDWKARVWDWRRKALSFEVEHTRAVSWVGFSQDEQLFYSLGGAELIVSSMTDKRPITTIEGMNGARCAAIHPSGQHAVVGFQDRLGIVDLQQKRLVKNLWVNRKTETLDPFAQNPEAFLRACLEGILDNPALMEKLGISSEARSEILRDPKAVKKLSVQSQAKIGTILEKVRADSRVSFETKEHTFDVRFHPSGKQLFVASSGMRVFDWSALLSAEGDAPAPHVSVDSPRDDETDPNSRPLTYCVRFDEERNLLLSSCLAGVVQFYNFTNGQSGILLKPPGETRIWRLELTSDKQALCCQCSDRPRIGVRNKNFNCVQVWNYPALCKAAGIS